MLIHSSFFRRTFTVFLTVLYCFSISPPAAIAEGQTSARYRALLVACDDFVHAASMYPIGENNIRMMETVLSHDTRGFEIYRQYGITSSVAALSAAVQWAFGDAQEGDVSLLYLCTHGEYDSSQETPEVALLLSDGYLEDRIYAHELKEILDTIAGEKVLIVDACNSGALIGKGVSPDAGADAILTTFQADGYKVLTSSGANELSWNWISGLEDAPPGSSYFTTALTIGTGYLGDFPADANRDGTITLAELYNYLWINQASSAVQIYPQDDSFPLLVYDRDAAEDINTGQLTGIVFQSTQLDPKSPSLTFSYTVTTDTRVVYSITYLKDGKWDWAHTVTFADVLEFDGDADPMGDVSPGRKQVELDETVLGEILPEGWTYAMIHIMTRGKGREDGSFIYASRVLSARQTEGDPMLSINTRPVWARGDVGELGIFVSHNMPCTLTADIYNISGELVRRLCVSEPTRPQALSPEGSLFYWNGLDEDGRMVPAGNYRITASTRIGDVSFKADTWVRVQ